MTPRNSWTKRDRYWLMAKPAVSRTKRRGARGDSSRGTSHLSRERPAVYDCRRARLLVRRALRPSSPAIEDFVPPSTSRRPVLVTGGAGYIGSVTVGRLLAEGRAVRVLDAMMFGDGALAAHRASPQLEVQVGDVRDPAAVARAVDGVDGVLHLAGLVGDPACALDPALTRAVNVDSTVTLA